MLARAKAGELPVADMPELLERILTGGPGGTAAGRGGTEALKKGLEAPNTNSWERRKRTGRRGVCSCVPPGKTTGGVRVGTEKAAGGAGAGTGAPAGRGGPGTGGCGRLAVAREKLPRYAELERARLAVAEREQGLRQARTESEQLRTLHETLTARQDTLQKESEGLRGAGEELARTEASLREAETRLQRLRQAHKLCEAAASAEQELEAAQKAYVDARTAYDRSRREYEGAHQAFLDAQAGLLARTLREGEPCPVCGAREHPMPARCLSAPPPSRRSRPLGRRWTGPGSYGGAEHRGGRRAIRDARRRELFAWLEQPEGSLEEAGRQILEQGKAVRQQQETLKQKKTELSGSAGEAGGD
ncbi:MAG: hypothetical protein V8Q30_05545 [Acutalibacteraceae bacterium]